MENKPIIPGLSQETEQQSIQRRANRPRRQPAGLPDDRDIAEMQAALEGAINTAEVAPRAANQLAPPPMTVLDDGDDGIIMETSESIQQSLEKQLAAAKAQLKDYNALLDAARSLTGSTEDTPAGALKKGLVSAWEEQQTDVRVMKTELEHLQREKDQTQATLKVLEDELSVLRKDRVYKACKKHQMKWWKRFCLCGGFRKNNKVGVAPDEDDQTEDWETHFADQLTKQSSTIRSLEKDKAILEAQIAKLQGAGVAAKRMVKEMGQKNKEMEKKRKQMEKEKKRAEKEKKKAEGEKLKAEREKEKAEKMKKEMEGRMKQEQRKKEYVDRLNRVLIEKLSVMKQDIELKTEQINQLNSINDKLQTITELKVMRETKINVDRIVIACLSFVVPQELATQDLMTFDQSSASASQHQTALGTVGKGAFGEVMLGRLSGERDPVAIKRALVRQGLTAELEESDRKRRDIRFKKEALVGFLMSGSPYFPRFMGTVVIGEDHCLVTEFIGDKIQGKSYILFDAIVPRKGRDPFPVIQKWNLMAIAEDIIRGVMALHGRSLLHNDIKDDNVLLEFRRNRWVAVIIDLGMVSTVTYPYFSGCKKSMSSNEKGYFIHVAPEVLKGLESSVASDIYSVGIILDTIGRFIKDDGLCTLASMCCKEDPKERPSDLDEILPGVIDIKEKHKTVARLEREPVATDTEEEEEGEEEEENILPEEDAWEEVEESDGEEQGGEVGEVDMVEEDRYQVGGVGHVEEPPQRELEEEEGEEEGGNEEGGYEAGENNDGGGNIHVEVENEGPQQENQQDDIALNNRRGDDERRELAEAADPLGEELPHLGEAVCVCVCWVFTDVYQSDMIIYVWDRPFTSPSERRDSGIPGDTR